MKKGSGTALTLAALAVLAFLPGCRGGELTEEERQKLIAEMGEEGRAYQEKRRRFLESPLCAAGLAYLRETADALVPGGNPEFSLEPGDYIEAEEAFRNASILVFDYGWNTNPSNVMQIVKQRHVIEVPN